MRPPVLSASLALALVTGALVTGLPASATAAQITVQSAGPVIELVVTESVASRPDLADITAGVTTRAPTAVAAMRQNAEAMAQVVARIRRLGIAGDDIRTVGVQVSADYEYDQADRRQVFQGYQASNRVRVTLRDVSRIGPVLDALVEAGANEISGPDFRLADDAAPAAQARTAAMRRAQAQATEYARAAGFNGTRLLRISEDAGRGAPQPMMRSDAVRVSGSSVPTPVEPGQIETAVTISVTFEMTR